MVLASALPSLACPTKYRPQRQTVTVSAVLAVSVVIATRLKVNPPFPTASFFRSSQDVQWRETQRPANTAAIINLALLVALGC